MLEVIFPSCGSDAVTPESGSYVSPTKISGAWLTPVMVGLPSITVNEIYTIIPLPSWSVSDNVNVLCPT